MKTAMGKSRIINRGIPLHLNKYIRRLCAVGLLLGWGSLVARPVPSTSNSGLRIYFVDVEGGQSTLFVTPAGQSLLIDTGWDGNNGRDADRIVAAAKNAGAHEIDYVLITHFHE